MSLLLTKAPCKNGRNDNKLNLFYSEDIIWFDLSDMEDENQCTGCLYSVQSQNAIILQVFSTEIGMLYIMGKKHVLYK